MSVRPYREIHRRKSRKIMVGNVPVGGDAPVTVQTMTNTPTTDVDATVAQSRDLAHGLAEASVSWLSRRAKKRSRHES